MGHIHPPHNVLYDLIQKEHVSVKNIDSKRTCFSEKHCKH